MSVVKVSRKPFSTGAVTLTYSQTVLADSPSFYYKLGEPSGTTMTDSSGNSHTGTYRNSPTLGATGLVSDGTAVTFNGTTQDATIGTGLPSTAPFTLEAWVKPSALVSVQTIASRNSSWYFASNGAKLRLTFPFVGDHDTTGDQLTAGVTAHVVAVFKADLAVDWYVNGAFIETVASVGSPQAGSDDGSVASHNATDLFWAGTLQHVAVYASALSAARIAAHYNAR